MATLTEVAYYTRRGVIFGVIGVVTLFILKFALDFGISYWKEKNPSPPPKPTVAFGKLPKIQFPQNKTYPQIFELQTIEGRPPESSPSARVFFIAKKSPTLFSRKEAEDFARKLGFTSSAKVLSPTLYQFVEETTGDLLTLDIAHHNFSLKVNYLDPSVFSEGNLPGREEIILQARKYFSSLGIWDDALTEAKISYLKFDGQKLVATTSLSTAQAVRVDFLKKEIEEIPLLPLEYDKSSVYIIFSASKEKTKQVLEANFYNFPPDLKTSATYPLILGRQAWENLKNGKAYIARFSTQEEKAVVRKIYLAYLETPEYQPYLQPVFVFEGDRGFVAYTSAIDPFWVGE